MELSEIQPSDALQQAEPQETQGEKSCSTVSLLKCRFPSFQNRMLSRGSSLVLSVHVCAAQTTLSYDVCMGLALSLSLCLIHPLFFFINVMSNIELEGLMFSLEKSSNPLVLELQLRKKKTKKNRKLSQSTASALHKRLGALIATVTQHENTHTKTIRNK